MTLFTQKQDNVLCIRVAIIDYTLLSIGIDDIMKMMNFKQDKIEKIVKNEELDILIIMALV